MGVRSAHHSRRLMSETSDKGRPAAKDAAQEAWAAAVEDTRRTVKSAERIQSTAHTLPLALPAMTGTAPHPARYISGPRVPLRAAP